MSRNGGEKRVFRVRVNRMPPVRYYTIGESSGCPAASFRVPYGDPGSRVVVRDNR